jgi:type IV fimbrial biogenesis protein FimT
MANKHGSIFQRQVGFTLIELMITLVVAAILLTVGVPSFVDLLQRNRMASLANEMVGSMQMARSEAVTRNATVTMCAKLDNTTCGGASWGDGWLIFIDVDGDAVVDAGDDDLVLNVMESDSEGVDYTATATDLTYLPSGQSDNTADVIFTLCPDRGDGRLITLSSLGRPATTKTSCP